MSELEMDLYDLEKLEYDNDYLEYLNFKANYMVKRMQLIDKHKVDKLCPRCHTSLIPSVISDYDYQCLYCDEDFYDCEVE